MREIMYHIYKTKYFGMFLRILITYFISNEISTVGKKGARSRITLLIIIF